MPKRSDCCGAKRGSGCAETVLKNPANRKTKSDLLKKLFLKRVKERAEVRVKICTHFIIFKNSFLKEN
jgi:ribosomal protein L28